MKVFILGVALLLCGSIGISSLFIMVSNYVVVGTSGNALRDLYRLDVDIPCLIFVAFVVIGLVLCIKMIAKDRKQPQ